MVALISCLALASACGSPPAEFGVERRVAAEQRPTVWDAPSRYRLLFEEEPKVWVGDAPAGWEVQPPQPTNFKDLIWRIPGDPGADCWLTGGVRGGLAGNMARWYRQFEQPVGRVDELPEVPFCGERGRLLELTGSYNKEPGKAMLLAFRSRGQFVTTLKLVGPEAVVKANREKFLALASSLRQEAAPPTAGSGGSRSGAAGNGGQKGSGPAGGNPHQQNPHGAGGHGEAVAELYDADVPEAWQRRADSAKPMHHTFGKDGAGEVYVSQLSGKIRPMLGIWRAELGIEGAMADAEFEALPTCEMLGEGALWLDLTGDYRNMMTGKKLIGARSLIAVRDDGGTITFAKMIGPATDVMAEVEAFKAFCKSLRKVQ
ncbi:MAG: hypothetical protein NXI31_03490 [bacterium]|nr:hypothetical protein [bacterium]